VIFQGIYSTKRRRDPRTWPGYALNRRALLAAAHVFTNKHADLANLRRIVPEDRLTYVRPGIRPEEFVFDPAARREVRAAWGAGDAQVILSAAMFRPGVKTQGLRFLFDALAGLDEEFLLVVAGDGVERAALEDLAGRLLPGRVRFLGKVPRADMGRVYSGADLFAFPGIRESLGMVYLEAQSCGLPVVAFDGWGVPEVVEDSVTGLLSRPFDREDFRSMIARLLRDGDLRRAMGLAAAGRVRREHDLELNYAVVERVLGRVIEDWNNRTKR
jgi:glycosyltransferase involved in cell wall biosynthesis